MNKNEIFVSQSLVEFLKKRQKIVSYSEGEDPPDIYVECGQHKTPVEISIIDENSLNNRNTVAMGYSAQVRQLNDEFSNTQTDGIKIIISIYHGGVKAGRIKKELKKFINKIISDRDSEVLGYKTKIKNVLCRATKQITTNKKVKITALISPINKSGNKIIDPHEFHLESRVASLITDRINVKSSKCKHIESPKWLALYDNYYNKFCDLNDKEHEEVYRNAMNSIANTDEFERIYIIFENRDVIEFSNM